MFSLTKANRSWILDFLASQGERPFSYPGTECTRKGRPSGHTADHKRVLLGHQLELYRQAKEAKRQWRLFDMSWLELCWPDAPIHTGTMVAIAISHLGFWSLNASRIVEVEDATIPERCGFAYGTLPEHQEIGEERFLVQFDAADGSVWYDLYAISRPGVIARLEYPFTRALHKSFARHSLRAMRNFVESG